MAWLTTLLSAVLAAFQSRAFWAGLSRVWPPWREVLVIVQPETVIAWRRRRFREYWVRLNRSGKPVRPAVPREIRDLTRRMSTANPLWGAPRIGGELGKIGIEQVAIAPRSLWLTPFVERLVGSIRCECLDHMIVLGRAAPEAHPHLLLRLLSSLALPSSAGDGLA